MVSPKKTTRGSLKHVETSKPVENIGEQMWTNTQASSKMNAIVHGSVLELKHDCTEGPDWSQVRSKGLRTWLKEQQE